MSGLSAEGQVHPVEKHGLRVIYQNGETLDRKLWLFEPDKCTLIDVTILYVFLKYLYDNLPSLRRLKQADLYKFEGSVECVVLLASQSYIVSLCR